MDKYCCSQRIQRRKYKRAALDNTYNVRIQEATKITIVALTLSIATATNPTLQAENNDLLFRSNFSLCF